MLKIHLIAMQIRPSHLMVIGGHFYVATAVRNNGLGETYVTARRIKSDGSFGSSIAMNLTDTTPFNIFIPL